MLMLLSSYSLTSSQIVFWLVGSVPPIYISSVGTSIHVLDPADGSTLRVMPLLIASYMPPLVTGLVLPDVGLLSKVSLFCLAAINVLILLTAYFSPSASKNLVAIALTA